MKLLPRRPATSSICSLAAAVLLAACASSDEPAADATSAELLAWADAQADQHQLDKATSAYRRVLQRDSLAVPALLGLASVYQAQEQSEPADRYRRRAFHVRYQQGLDWIEAGAADSARTALESASRIIPRHPLAHLRLGELAQVAGQPDSAVAHFEKAVEANPHYAESLIILGQAYAAAQRAEDAQSAFERAIEANINALDAYLGLGRIFSASGEWAIAAAQFEKALLINPKSVPALAGLDQVRSHLHGHRSG